MYGGHTRIKKKTEMSMINTIKALLTRNSNRLFMGTWVIDRLTIHEAVGHSLTHNFT